MVGLLDGGGERERRDAGRPRPPCSTAAPTDAELAALEARAARCAPGTARTLRRELRRELTGTRCVSTLALAAAVEESDHPTPAPGAERSPT